MNIKNPWADNYAIQQPEPCGGRYLVETAGYIPKDVQLQMLIQSGESLERYRKKMFPHYQNLEDTTPDDDIPYDPTSHIGYDFFDFHRDHTIAKNGLKESERQARIALEANARAKDKQSLGPQKSPETAEPKPETAPGS